MNDTQNTNDSNAVGNRRLATGPAAPPPSGAALSSPRVTERTEICPQCGSLVIQPRDSEDYCEECGWPDDNRTLNIMEKTLHNSDISGARQNVPDIKVVGNGDTFRLLCKASSQNEGWMKSSKAMEVPGGCVVQVTTQQKNIDGTYSVAEALTFVPGVKIADDENGGWKLVAA